MKTLRSPSILLFVFVADFCLEDIHKQLIEQVMSDLSKHLIAVDRLR